MDDQRDSPDGVCAVTLYTIGHSNHEPAVFLSLLRGRDIDLVVDVRSSPYSRHVPQANREPLARALHQARIEYRWRGAALGGKPEGNPGDYDQIRKNPAFHRGLAEIVELARDHRVVLMCSEGDHRRCHRHLLLEPALRDLHVRVLHIQPDGSFSDEVERPHQLPLF